MDRPWSHIIDVKEEQSLSCCVWKKGRSGGRIANGFQFSNEGKRYNIINIWLYITSPSISISFAPQEANQWTTILLYTEYLPFADGRRVRRRGYCTNWTNWENWRAIGQNRAKQASSIKSSETLAGTRGHKSSREGDRERDRELAVIPICV